MLFLTLFSSILPEYELEQFEDDPLEFIRLDLSPTSSSDATRRQAAADVLQALVGSGYETETTALVGGWITEGLKAYEADKGPDNTGWKAKDSAVYLLGAVATRGSTTLVCSLYLGHTCSVGDYGD